MLITALVFVLLACSQKDETILQPVNTGILKTDFPQGTCTPGAIYDLWGGQTLDWGTVQVWTDQTNLYVQYLVNENIPNLTISQIHVWIGTTASGFPKNGQGVPVPGQFPISITFNPTVTEYLVIQPLVGGGITLICDQPIYIMAHAVMSDGYTTQTAWGGVAGCMQNVPGKGTGRWYFEIGLCGELTYKCNCYVQNDVCTGYQDETAYGGNLTVTPAKPGNQAWFNYYLTATGGAQTLWAAKTINAGTVAYTAADNGTITITFSNEWEANTIANPNDWVKMEGYYTLPTNRPEPGLMAIKTNTQTIIGVNDPATGLPYPYYIIHVDVIKCVSWGSGQ